MVSRLLGLLLLPFALGPALAGEDAAVARVMAAEVVAGDRLRLADGRVLRLDGIRTPRPEHSGRLADSARRAVENLVEGANLRLVFDGRRQNRYGDLLAQVHATRAGGREVWVQAALLERGLARVEGLPENRRAIPALLAIEAEARTARRGLWAYRRFAVLRAEQAASHLGSFQIVEGRVLAAAIVKGRGYLNFGQDWKTDFTLTLDRAARRRFAQNGLDPLSLEGRRLRVRGWLKSFNGPMIELSHPEQIELLEERPK